MIFGQVIFRQMIFGQIIFSQLLENQRISDKIQTTSYWLTQVYEVWTVCANRKGKIELWRSRDMQITESVERIFSRDFPAINQ